MFLGYVDRQLYEPADFKANSFVYDVKNDTYSVWIRDFQTDLYEKYNLEHMHAPLNFDSGGYVYWLDTSRPESHDLIFCKNNNASYCSLLIIDISNILNFQILNQILIDRNEKEFVDFIDAFNMFIIGNNTIHFISQNKTAQHYIFDIKLSKLKLINETIQLNRIKPSQYTKDINIIWNILKEDNNIDARHPQYGMFFPAIIRDVKKIGKNIKKLLIHYNDFGDKFDEWIEINKELESINIIIDINSSIANPSSVICNCNNLCKYRFCRLKKSNYNNINQVDPRFNFDKSYSKLHRIAYPGTQTKLIQQIQFRVVIYCKIFEKFLLFGVQDGWIFEKHVNCKWYQWLYP